MKIDWLIYALLSAFFAGLVAIFGKVGVRDVDSTLATAVRAIVMALALVALVLAKSAGGNSSIQRELDVILEQNQRPNFCDWRKLRLNRRKLA
jgi:uncharacterized membrane protein